MDITAGIVETNRDVRVDTKNKTALIATTMDIQGGNRLHTDKTIEEVDNLGEETTMEEKTTIEEKIFIKEIRKDSREH
ncbi:hypothetical protein PoB_006169800 [Plakobranchus ocellatus]|uniref:Uncharacterized protein n=1 Tax=Plakobranchus ocellatus TaxID=259542 RepID=A0AAV4CTJ1_9GAST|nr:hypothetical protein PoB_006169800 [Plakobranchus ocellatus]